MLLASRRRKVGGTPNRGRMSMLARAKLSIGVGRCRPPNSGSSNMKVIVRVRPRSDSDEGKDLVKVIDDKLLVFDPKEEDKPFYVGGVLQKNRDMLKKKNRNIQFIFDRVFGYSATNHDVFEGSTKELINSLLDGFNCSVFVYGATGAGKTYTMLGNKANPGICYLTMVELYKAMDKMKDEKEFDLNISYLEVYNERVHDLIKPSGPLNIHDDGTSGTVVSGIYVHRITHAEELFSMLEKGNSNRTQHPTDANAESSRSHAVFQVMIRISHKFSSQVKVAKLLMIDLAGSERGTATGGKGTRFSEGSNINKSLLALGNCVTALADGQKHIPYRDSKLTRLLKDSLGGNCKTVMIANVSPNVKTFEETFNTLNYATRARTINTKVHSNVYSVNMHVGQYVKLVAELQHKVSSLEQQLEEEKSKKEIVTPISDNVVSSEHRENVARWKTRFDTLFQELSSVQADNLRYKSEISVLEHKLRVKKETFKRLNKIHCAEAQIAAASRVGTSVARLERQLETYKTQKNIAEAAVVKCEGNLLEARNELEEEGLSEELREAVDMYQHKLDKDGLILQLQSAERLNLLQRNEITTLEKITREMTSVFDHYYTVLRGYDKLTNNMKQMFNHVVNLLSGAKEVSWKETPSKDRRRSYSLLKKVIGFSMGGSENQQTEVQSPLHSSIAPATSIFTPIASLFTPRQKLTPEARNMVNVTLTPKQNVEEVTEETTTGAEVLNCSQDFGSAVPLSHVHTEMTPEPAQRPYASKLIRRGTFAVHSTSVKTESCGREYAQEFTSSGVDGRKFIIPPGTPTAIEQTPELNISRQTDQETFLKPPFPQDMKSSIPQKLNSSEDDQTLTIPFAKSAILKQPLERNRPVRRETFVVPVPKIPESMAFKPCNKLNFSEEDHGRNLDIPSAEESAVDMIPELSRAKQTRRETYVIPSSLSSEALAESSQMKITMQKISPVLPSVNTDAELMPVSSHDYLDPKIISGSNEHEIAPSKLNSEKQHELNSVNKSYFTRSSEQVLMTPDQRRAKILDRLSCHRPFFGHQLCLDDKFPSSEQSMPLLHAPDTPIVDKHCTNNCDFPKTDDSGLPNHDSGNGDESTKCSEKLCVDEPVQNISHSKVSPSGAFDVQNSSLGKDAKVCVYNLRSSCCGCPSHILQSSDAFRSTRVSQKCMRNSRGKKTSSSPVPEQIEEEKTGTYTKTAPSQSHVDVGTAQETQDSKITSVEPPVSSPGLGIVEDLNGTYTFPDSPVNVFGEDSPELDSIFPSRAQLPSSHSSSNFSDPVGLKVGSSNKQLEQHISAEKKCLNGTFTATSSHSFDNIADSPPGKSNLDEMFEAPPSQLSDNLAGSPAGKCGLDETIITTPSSLFVVGDPVTLKDDVPDNQPVEDSPIRKLDLNKTFAMTPLHVIDSLPDSPAVKQDLDETFTTDPSCLFVNLSDPVVSKDDLSNQIPGYFPTQKPNLDGTTVLSHSFGNTGKYGASKRRLTRALPAGKSVLDETFKTVPLRPPGNFAEKPGLKRQQVQSLPAKKPHLGPRADLNSTFVVPATKKAALPSQSVMPLAPNKVLGNILTPAVKRPLGLSKGIPVSAQRLRHVDKENKPFLKPGAMSGRTGLVTPKSVKKTVVATHSSVKRSGGMRRGKGTDEKEKVRVSFPCGLKVGPRGLKKPQSAKKCSW